MIPAEVAAAILTELVRARGIDPATLPGDIVDLALAGVRALGLAPEDAPPEHPRAPSITDAAAALRNELLDELARRTAPGTSCKPSTG